MRTEQKSTGLMSVEDAAAFLGGLSPSTIRNWLTKGRLTRIKIGSRTMVHEDELRKLIKPQPTREHVTQPAA
jgi:excisionase family DNA binding protein